MSIVETRFDVFLSAVESIHVVALELPEEFPSLFLVILEASLAAGDLELHVLASSARKLHKSAAMLRVLLRWAILH